MFDFMMDGAFWMSVGQIILIDILLGGDNAVVIALACRKLPRSAAQAGHLLGRGRRDRAARRADLLRPATARAALAEGGRRARCCCGSASSCCCPRTRTATATSRAALTCSGAIKTIIVADAVMSLDNVIAVAGAAKGSWRWWCSASSISIPIIVWGSQFVLRLMDRFPVVITLGAALLGWIGGDMIVSDVVVKPYLEGAPGWLHYATAAAGALLVVALGTWLARRKQAAAAPVTELALDPASRRDYHGARR